MNAEMDFDLDERPKRDPLFARVEQWLAARLGPAAPALPIAIFLFSCLYLDYFMNAAPGATGLSAVRPSPDVLVLLAAMCVAAWFGLVVRPWMYMAVAVVMLGARIFQVADHLMMSVFDRPFEPYPELLHFWDLLAVLDDAVPRLVLMTYLALSALGLGALTFLARQSLIRASRFFEHRSHRVGFLVAAAALVLGGLGVPNLFGPWVAARAAAQFGSFGDAWSRGDDVRGEAAAAAEGISRGAARLDGRDVYLFFVASYGGGLHRDPGLASALDDFERAVARARYSVASTSLVSPVRGGLPELAYDTLETGVRLGSAADQSAWREGDFQTLASLLRESGHRTLRVLPGVTRERPDEDSRRMGFDLAYFSWRLGYQGPAHGTVAVPDQYTLDIILRREIKDARGPLFIEYGLTSSAPPWSGVPPYVERWRDLGDGAMYAEEPGTDHDVGWWNMGDGHDALIAALRYTFGVLQHYLTDELPRRTGRHRRRVRRAPLIVVLGDHPPPAGLGSADAGHAVPVHVISRDRVLVQSFVERGYTEGLAVPQQPSGGLEQLAQGLGAPEP